MVRTRIRRSDGVLAIISKDSLTSIGQKWEIQCGKEASVPLRGIWGYKDDRTDVSGVKIMLWTWDNVTNWLDSL